ncbi:hypothetical protein ACT8ZV_08900 [Nocardioides sp. MAHUQ-72]|uniref:hypothetical protein n=1 Tax=unclassified Nocardioides TaxID=2615069 RepID=UPI003614FF79
MGVRGLGAVLALALLGAAGGFATGHVLRDAPVAAAEAAPVPASDPSIPVDPVRDFAPDIGYPPLQAGLDYRRHTLGDAPYEWVYAAPKGWVSTTEALDEVRWRPADEPTVGGFSLRVKLSTEHKTKAAMVAQKLSAMQAGYEDVEVLGQTQDLLSFSYRDPDTDRLRFNTFQWFSVPGSDEATFEMSVVGREVDRTGLDNLMTEVSRSIAKVQ